MSEATDAQAVAAVLRHHGVGCVFGGGEPPGAPLPGGLAEAGIPVVRTLHQQTAVFAADGWARVTRRPGVALLGGRVGLPNAITGIANAHASGSPVVVIDDRRQGGPFDVVDHRAMIRTITRATTTVGPESLPAALAWACEVANRAPRGPVLVEVVDPAALATSDGVAPDRAAPIRSAPTPPDGAAPDGAAPRLAADTAEAAEPDKAALEEIAELLREAERPVLVAGGNVYWAGAEASLRRFAEELGVPVVMNGMGRGTLPADHALALSRARPSALRGADLVVVAGTPLDFRLGYGRFGSARVVHLCDDPGQIATHADLAAAAAGDLGLIFDRLAALAGPGGSGPAPTVWADGLRLEETGVRRAEEEDWARAEQADQTRRAGQGPRCQEDERGGELHAERSRRPLRAPGFYRELRRWLERDAVVIGDGGDFVSFAGRFVDTFTPGCFLDPGPYGCLGIGLGYALGARAAHPDRQVVVLLGDGAAGFSLMELETLVRYGLGAVVIVGNNDGWGLEKEHMQALYGYHVVAELAPGTRYDEVARGLGAQGELVREAAELGPAMERAFSAQGPVLVNVALDPADAYPRSTALA